MHSWKEKIKMRNKTGLGRGSKCKSTLNVYKLANNGAGVERYLRLVQGQEVVRL